MFSIVMPVWNKEEYVAATLTAALAQSFADFELIVVDDGSADRSMTIVRGFDDPRIRILAQANAGPGLARNAGIAVARHDWIAFLDADDIWLPDHLAELDRIRHRHPEAGLIGTAFAIGDRDGACLLSHDGGHSIRRIGYFDGARPFITSSAAIHRRSFEALGGFGDVVPGEDCEYWARIALHAPIFGSGRVTTIYRMGTGGITDSLGSPWRGRSIATVGDLAPTVALLVDRYPAMACPNMRATVDRFIRRKLRVCVRTAARFGDLATLRALPALYRDPLPLEDRMILAAARLPAPLARGAHRVGFRLKALGRALRPRGR
jgi:glycosyltransferase involved in cell wall biosynthesis